MRYRIGTDEAGYGPTLGPLVVSATLWRETSLDANVENTANADAPERFLETLAEIFATDPPRRAASRAGDGNVVEPRLIAADSKKIYSPTTGLSLLESQVRGFLTLAGIVETRRTTPGAAVGTATRPTRWRTLLARLAPADAARLDDSPWYRDADPELFHPTAADANGVANVAAVDGRSGDPILAAVDAARRRMGAAGIGLVSVGSRFLDAAAFNAGLDRCESKADLLAEMTLGLVARFLGEIASEHMNTTRGDDGPPIDVAVFCDKFGGRNHYAPLLMRIFHSEWANAAETENTANGECGGRNNTSPFGWPRAIVEGRAESVYRLENERFRLRIHFTAKGERRVPVAVASMVSKYLRETAMERFNDFWRCRWSDEHVNERSLSAEPPRPTAGYPEDAVRFLAQIEPLRAKLGIPDAALRRMK